MTGSTVPAAPPAPRELPLAIRAADVDLGACRAWVDGQPSEEPVGTAPLTALGLQGSGAWAAADRHTRGKTRDYLFVFTQPIAVGSVLFQQGGSLRLLKPGVALPADPGDTNLWITVAFPSSQSGFRLAALPPGTTTKAVLCSLKQTWGDWSRLTLLRLFKERLYNAIPDAVPNAEAEYIRHNRLGPPTPFLASNVTRGWGAWQSHGPDNNDRIDRAPVSDVDPSWFVVSWDAPQTFTTIVLRSNFQRFKLFAWRGPDKINPAVGGASDWELVKTGVREEGGQQWVAFAPVKTRGFKFLVEGTSDPKFAQIDGLHAWTDLGDGPVPVRVTDTEVAPCQIPLSLAADVQFSMAIDDARGRRVRNVAMREDRKAGAQVVAWDLKDDQGTLVPAGTYHWKALWNPGLELRYEMTPYPNVTSTTKENSPWLNGQSGPGGWLADHSSPRAACATGDRMFISAPCCESGVGLIECDLEGRKYWGHGNIIAWTSPSFLAADGNALYASPWSQGDDYVWRFSLPDKKLDTLLQLAPTATRRRGLRGLAARDGKLYLSIDAGASTLENGPSSADVDLDHCEPRYGIPRKSNKDDDPDPRADFLRMFRLTGTPAGNRGLIYLETAKQPAPRQHIVLAMNRPVPVGSFAFPCPGQGLTLHLSVLKPDAPYPPDPNRDADWIRFWKGSGKGWTVVPAPSNTITRAVRLSFDKGMNELDEVLAEDDAGDGLALTKEKATKKSKSSWNAQLEGMKILRRRFESLSATCKVTVNSGTITADGVWDAKREKPLTEADPGIYMMTWDQAQSIRGLAVKEIDGRYTDIDAWVGDGAPDMKAAQGWEKLATYEQKLRYYYQPDQNNNANARYIDGYVDFGRDVKTRALRLRVTEQWMWKEEGRNGCVGVRRDRGAQDLDPTRCRVYGVAPVQYLGGEDPVDTLASGRMEIYDTATAKLVKDLPLTKGGDLAFDPSGTLYACSGGGVIKVDLADGQHTPLKLDVKQAWAITCDKAGNLYVFDGAPDQRVVKVFDPSSKLLRTIGTPGGRVVGPWDPSRFGSSPNVAIDLAIDKLDQLWIVECDTLPKRVSIWGLDGTFKKDLLGNTPYGGGGCLDPYDKTRLFYEGLEFALDWNTGLTRIKNVTWLGDSPAGEVPIKVKDRLYLVTRPEFLEQQLGMVYVYEKDHLRRVAAMGRAGMFRALRTPDILGKLGRKPIGDFAFAWSDRNGDGNPQADEVEFFENNSERGESLTRFDDSLCMDAGSRRYAVKEILANGAPVYERQVKAFGDHALEMTNGNYFVIGNNEVMAERRPDGKTVWTHPAEGWGVHALYSAKPWFPGQVVAQFGVIGHETTPKGDLGEFFVTHGNSGIWHVWSSDGLLAGQIFRDMRGPGAKPWSMLEHERGMDLTDVTAGQEHFRGYFCRTREDNKYYVVSGHNHVSVVEVLGIDKIKRLGGDVEVTPEILAKSMEWDRKKQARKLYEAARVIECRRARSAVATDGVPSEWGFESARLGESDTSFAMSYDATNVYVCYRVRSLGPLKNAGNDWKRLFKTGASVDLQMGTDPAAPGDRKDPVAGDVRLLMTVNNDKGDAGRPVAVLYQPVAAGAKPEEAWETHTMVFRAAFDRVAQAPEVRIGVAPLDDGDGYCLEAAIPLKTLGLTIKPDLVVKMDWGVLTGGPFGTEVLQRKYWANPQTSIVSDEAAEAMLHPDLWGVVRFSTDTGKKSRPEFDMDKALTPGDGAEIQLDP